MTTAGFRDVLSKREAFWIILAAGILIRVLFFLWVADKPLMSDAVNYNDMSNKLLSGEAFLPYWPPGLPLYLAVVQTFFGPSVAAARLAMLIFYLGTSVVVHRASVLMTASQAAGNIARSEEHTSELQSPCNLVCRLL